MSSVATADLAGALRSCWRPLARRAARAYIAGTGLADAVNGCAMARQRGFATTIGFWDGGEPPRLVADQHLAALDAIGAGALRCYLSVKAPAVDFSSSILREVLARSARHRVRVHFDSLGPQTVEPTFALIESAVPHPPGLSCTLPARWRRSAADAERALALGLTVRLVKGEEPGDDGRDIDPRCGLLALVDQLAGRAQAVAIATHDAPLAREALTRLGEAGTPAELELLLGLPLRRSIGMARELRVPVRLYVPYGHARLPYRLSEIGTHPAVLWWAARDLVQEAILRSMPARQLKKES